MDGLLAFSIDEGPSQCSVGALKFSGSTVDWAGILYAPNGLTEMSASSNGTFHGSVVSYGVTMSGASMEINFNEDVWPQGDPTIELAE